MSATLPTLRQLVRRDLDDVVVHEAAWLRDSGVQHQLEFEGFRLRWVNPVKVGENLADGWSYVTVRYWMWWRRRVRRTHEGRTQYLLQRKRSRLDSSL